MNEAETLARTLAAVHDDLVASLERTDERMLRESVERITAEIRRSPSVRVHAAMASATSGPGWPD